MFQEIARFATPERRKLMDEYMDEQDDETSMDQVLKGLDFEIVGSGENFKYRSKI